MKIKHLKLVQVKGKENPIMIDEYINEINHFIKTKLDNHNRLNTFTHQTYYVISSIMVIARFADSILTAEQMHHSHNPMPEDLRALLQLVSKFNEFELEKK